MLQAFADFLAGPMHGEDGYLLAQEYLQMTALRGLKRTALLFEPPFELGAGHALRIQQICCTVNMHFAVLAHARNPTSTSPATPGSAPHRALDSLLGRPGKSRRDALYRR